MFRSNNAKRATLAARDLFMTGRPGNGRPSRNARSAHRLSQAGAVAHNDSRVRTTRLVAGALALGLLMMAPLAFGAAAYGTQGDCYKIEFHGNGPTTWVSNAHYATVTVKAGQVTKTWNDVQPGQTIGPIIRESNGKPIEFSHIVKCLPVETTTTTVPEEVTTTTVPEEVTTTTVPEEVTTTTVPEEVTTTTVPEEVTTTTVPEEVTTTTVPEEVTTTTVPEEVTTTTVPEEVTTTTVPEEVTTTTVPEEVTTTTVPEEVTTTTVPEEVTTTTVPDEETTTTVPDEETTTTVPDEVTTTTEPFAVPAEPPTPAEPTVPGTPDAEEQVRPIVNPRTTSESLPFTGSQHLQLLGLIGIVALAAGFGMIQLVNRSR